MTVDHSMGGRAAVDIITNICMVDKLHAETLVLHGNALHCPYVIELSS